MGEGPGLGAVGEVALAGFRGRDALKMLASWTAITDVRALPRSTMAMEHGAPSPNAD